MLFRLTAIRCAQLTTNGKSSAVLRPLTYVPGTHPKVHGDSASYAMKKILTAARNATQEGACLQDSTTEAGPLYEVYKLIETGQIGKALSICLENSPSDRHRRSEYFRTAISLFTIPRAFEPAVEIFNIVLAEDLSIHPSMILCLLRGLKHHHRKHVRQVFELARRALDTGRFKLEANILQTMLQILQKSGNSSETMEKFILYIKRKEVHFRPPRPANIGTLINAHAFEGNFDRAMELLSGIPYSGTGTQHSPTFMELIDSKAPETIYETAASPSSRFSSSPSNAKLTSPGRRSGCIPYTALVSGYRNFLTESAVPQAMLHSIARLMKLRGVVPDQEFYTTVLAILGIVKDSERMLGIYALMLQQESVPGPSCSTYRKLFLYLSGINSPSLSTDDLYKYTRGIFRDMLFHQQCIINYRDSPLRHVIELSSLNAALSCFLVTRNYQSALVVLRAFDIYRISPTKHTVHILLSSLRKPVMEDVAWAKNFLYGLQASIELSDLLSELQQVGRMEHNLKLVTGLDNEGNATLWALTEITLRALAAKYTKVKWYLPEALGLPESTGLAVKAAIHEAVQSMVPAPGEGTPQQKDFIYTNWNTIDAQREDENASLNSDGP